MARGLSVFALVAKTSSWTAWQDTGLPTPQPSPLTRQAPALRTPQLPSPLLSPSSSPASPAALPPQGIPKLARSPSTSPRGPSCWRSLWTSDRVHLCPSRSGAEVLMGLTCLPRLAPATLAAWLCPTRWAGTSQPQAFPADVPVPQSLSWGSGLFRPRPVSPVIRPVNVRICPSGGWCCGTAG